MFPAWPSKIPPDLDQLAYDLVAASAALGRGVHPLVLREIARFMKRVDSHYVHVMDGEACRLEDVEAAANGRWSEDVAIRNSQRAQLAYIAVRESMLERLRDEPGLRVGSENFLRWLHERLARGLPDDAHFASTNGGGLVPAPPGRLRKRGMSAGGRDAPASRKEIRKRLARLEKISSPESAQGSRRLLGMAVSYRGLLWIRPFPAGNEKVAGLSAIAHWRRIGVEPDGLWSVSRALARRRDDFDAQTRPAGPKRRGGALGGSPLSQGRSAQFCSFFLECCADQIRDMGRLLEAGDLERRYKGLVAGLVREKRLSKSGAKVMERLFSQGEASRSRVLEICGVKQRRATQVVRELLDADLSRSESAYGPLRLNLTAALSAVLFPGLL